MIIGVLVSLVISFFVYPRFVVSIFFFVFFFFFADVFDGFHLTDRLARKALPKDLSSTVQQLSTLYGRIVSHFLAEHAGVPLDADREFRSIEYSTQVALLRHAEYIEHAKREPSVRGPFPASSYTNLVKGCQLILDRFTTLRMAMIPSFESASKQIRRNFIVPAYVERSELVTNVILHFYILSGALWTELPLPAVLPVSEIDAELLVFKISFSDFWWFFFGLAIGCGRREKEAARQTYASPSGQGHVQALRGRLFRLLLLCVRLPPSAPSLKPEIAFCFIY
jgi:hypothetical protein